MFFLCTACVISILGNDIPSIFRSWERLLFFIILTTLVSPLIQKFGFCLFRIKIFWYIQWCILVVVILSFIAYWIGLGSNDLYYAGITGHSMILGPVSATSILFLVYLYFSRFSTLKKTSELLIFCMIASAVFLLLVSSSRGAFFSLIISLFYLFSIIFTCF